MENKGVKYDQDKIKWSYLPIKPVIEVLKVLEYGDKKYPAPDGANWKRVEDSKKRYFNACMRHMTAWYDVEENDPETGYSHLAHACACVLFLLWFSLNKQTEIEQEQTGLLEKQDDGWISWGGGDCPVDSETKMFYQLRAEDIRIIKQQARDYPEGYSYAANVRWTHENSVSDILAYKVVK